MTSDMVSPCIKVLAFTASMHRPLFLRASILQMQTQLYPCHHSIFLNSNQFRSYEDTTNYCSLFRDIKIKPAYKLMIAYGKQGHQHFNHITAIRQCTIDDYDVFIKIDDDDIYQSGYVGAVVEDFIKYQWDFSASFSDGLIDKETLIQNKKLGISKLLINGAHQSVMPGTFAFSKKAIKIIIEKGEHHTWKGMYEDPTWVTWIEQDTSLKKSFRKVSNYIYNIHESNSCSPRKV